MQKLKSCPFCGCKDCCIVKSHRFRFYSVECTQCGAMSSEELDIQQAVEDWNRRAYHEQIQP